MKKFITLKDNKIVGIRFGTKIVAGEIESEVGEIGQILSNGEYIDDPVDLAIEALWKEYADLEKKRKAFELGALTSEEYQPYKLRLIEVATELGVI